MNNRFPIYIPSYNRIENNATAQVLENFGIDYTLVVEKEEYDDYCNYFGEDKVIYVTEKTKSEYDTLDDLGQKKSMGPGPARNQAWKHAIENGFDWHWVMDDNIEGFYRHKGDKQIQFEDATPFRLIEDFVLQYQNISMAGMRYQFYFWRKYNSYPNPISFNTRIYSCNLIKNSINQRWRGRYNEDTILSMDIMSQGGCTALFNHFLQDKAATQTYDGGNNERFYSKEGTYPKSAMLKEPYPSLVEIVQKYGRWHHEVDYSPFKSNELKRKNKSDIPDEILDADYELKRK